MFVFSLLLLMMIFGCSDLSAATCLPHFGQTTHALSIMEPQCWQNFVSFCGAPQDGQVMASFEIS